MEAFIQPSGLRKCGSSFQLNPPLPRHWRQSSTRGEALCLSVPGRPVLNSPGKAEPKSNRPTALTLLLAGGVPLPVWGRPSNTTAPPSCCPWHAERAAGGARSPTDVAPESVTTVPRGGASGRKRRLGNSCDGYSSSAWAREERGARRSAVTARPRKAASPLLPPPHCPLTL